MLKLLLFPIVKTTSNSTRANHPTPLQRKNNKNFPILSCSKDNKLKNDEIKLIMYIFYMLSEDEKPIHIIFSSYSPSPCLDEKEKGNCENFPQL